MDRHKKHKVNPSVLKTLIFLREFVIKYPTCFIQNVVGRYLANVVICSGKKVEGINPPEIKIIVTENRNNIIIPVEPWSVI